MEEEALNVVNYKGWRILYDGWQSRALRSREDAIKVALGLIRSRNSIQVLVHEIDGQVHRVVEKERGPGRHAA
jgi:hypothetical protein